MTHSIAILRCAFNIFVNPFTLILILLVIGACRLYFIQDDIIAKVLILSATLGMLLFSTAILPKWLLSKLQKQYPVITKINPSIKWVVVLSGEGHGINESTAPANFLLNHVTINRLLEGVRLYNALPQAKLVLSGSAFHISLADPNFAKRLKRKNTDAVHMAILASWFKIPDKNIVIDLNAINTRDEALAIKKIVKDEPFYLVTSSLHMPRSMALFLKQDLHPIAAPSDCGLNCNKNGIFPYIIPTPHNLSISNVVWHEYIGRLWEKISDDS